MKLFFLSSFLIPLQWIAGQSPLIYEKYFDLGLTEWTSDAIATPTGGFLILGTSVTEGTFLLNIDSTGKIIWEKTYEGIGCYSITNCSTFGYLMAGFELIRIASDGSIIWEKTLDGIFGDYDPAYDIIKTAIPGDGGYILTGHNDWRAGLAKIDASGNLIWSQQYGNDINDRGYALIETANYAYIMTGAAYHEEVNSNCGWGFHSNLFITKTDNEGNVIWSKEFGDEFDDAGVAITKCGNNDFIIAGYRDASECSDVKAYLIRISNAGDVVWEKTYSGLGFANSTSISPTWDGGFILTGSTNGLDNPSSVYLYKIDADGNLLWEDYYGSDEESDGGTVAIETTDRNFFIAGAGRHEGSVSSDIYYLKVESYNSGTITVPALDSVMVFPNPASTYINISTNNEIDDLIIRFFDSAGKRIGVYEMPHGKAIRIMTPITRGMLFYEIIVDEEVIAHGKLIVI
ncbi:MAG: hypothetical protein ACHQFW_08140 [Chitinophagales bacterium]